MFKVIFTSIFLLSFASTVYGYDHLNGAKQEIQAAEQDVLSGNNCAAEASVQQAEQTIESRGRHDLQGNAVAAVQDLKNWVPGNGELPTAVQDLNQAMVVRQAHNTGAGYDHVLTAEAAARAAGHQVQLGNDAAAQADVNRAQRDLATRPNYNLGGYANAAQQALQNWVPGNGEIPAAVGDLQNAAQWRATH